MSDPVSNHDIEDVLSSIRRLVSQGDPRRAAPAPEPAPKAVLQDVAKIIEKQEETPKPATPDRLVLTPAFRIAPQDKSAEEKAKDQAAAEALKGRVASLSAAVTAPEDDIIPTKDVRPMPEPAQSPSQRASLEATIAELEAAVNNRTDDFEPDGSEVEEAPTSTFQSVFMNKLEALRPAAFRRSQPVEDTVEEEQSAPAATLVEPEIAPDAQPEEAAAQDEPQEDDATVNPTEAVLNDIVVDHVAEAVQSEIAEAFPQFAAADQAPTADETVVDDKAAELTSDAMSDPADSASEVEVAHVEIEDDSVAASDSERSAVDATTDEARVGRVEADVAEVEVLEPEMEPAFAQEDTVDDASATFRHAAPVEEVYDPVAEATADAAEAAPDADDMYGDDLAPDPNATGTAVATAAPAANGALVDPDMLRDLVGQMIRDELQGEMGERITRNVRKLVRREINRVLSAQEFD